MNIIANIVADKRKTVAVVSFNNEAVKNVKTKLEKNGYGFLVADLGNSEKRKNFFANQPSAQVESWNHSEGFTSLRQTLQKHSQELDYLHAVANRCAEIKQELAAYLLEQEYFLQFRKSSEAKPVRALPFYKSAKTPANKILDCLTDIAITEKLSPLTKFCHKLKLLLKYRIYAFNKLNPVGIDQILHMQEKFYSAKIEELELELSTKEALLKRQSFNELTRLHQKLSERMFQKLLYDMYAKLEKPQLTASNYLANFKDFLKSYPVVLSTNHSLRNSIPPNFLLDYLIIDEASQVDLLTGILVISCCKNIIIVGDLKQLPQIVDCRLRQHIDKHVPAEYDYFSHNILSSFLALYKDIPCVTLKEHYRCHPAIIEFCNQKYYDGELIPFTEASLSKTPLVLIKTATGNHMRKVTHNKSGEKGIYNQREIDVLLQEARAYAVSEDIGHATPYRKQADKAKKLLPKEIASDTVHKFQGREQDVIIMTTVIDSSLAGQRGLRFVDDPCLINVAVSRAIKQFMLITDDTLFQQKGRHVRDLVKYIQYRTMDSCILDSNLVSIFDLLYQNFSKNLLPLQAKLIKCSKYTSENIVNTRLGAILSEQTYSGYSAVFTYYLRSLTRDLSVFNESEQGFINNNASLDFVIFNKQDKQCVGAIEVDGFAFHENNAEQLERDALKNSILQKIAIPLLRLPTNGSGEEKKIRDFLDSL